MELRQVMRIARRRGWLVVLLMIVGGTAAYISSSRQTPEYAASATMLVTPGQVTSTADLGALQASRSLAETYRLLVATGPVLDRAIAELNLPLDSDQLNAMVSTSIVGETQLVEVTVLGTDPELAAEIANTIVEEFTDYVGELAQDRAELTQTDLDSQIARLEERLAEIDARTEEINASGEVDDAGSQQELADLELGRSNIEESLQTLNTTAITLNTEMIASSALVGLIDPADAPTTPVAPRVQRSALLGVFAGLLIGVALVALLEYLDNTVKPEMDTQSITGAPVLAAIASVPKLQSGAAQVFSMARPHSNASEAVRMLRTNLEFAAAPNPIVTLTISSPGPSEGKSTVTANLGVVMAQAGFDTVILDADLRRPTQHRIFGIENARGLTTLLTNPDVSWSDVAAKVALPGLRLVPTGPLPPNPSDLLSSDRFSHLLANIKADVDLVLIDTPPLLAVSDAMSVAAHTDGVALVATSRKTRVEGLRHAAETVQLAGIRLVGVVMNRTRGQAGGGYYYDYYGPEKASVGGLFRRERRNTTAVMDATDLGRK